MVVGRDEPGPPLLVSYRRYTVTVLITPLRLHTHARDGNVIVVHTDTHAPPLAIDAPRVPHARELRTADRAIASSTAELPNSLRIGA